ncbi:MAG: lipopolysaccharide assembly protein LapA domain-containing protein [Humidesulfovibrio sp.]|uniref:lipopolysaccharide assembly protein LapA domain-containing protein n=1 Tax=Humidesulfovibrio sp. TaxID=2910988 RepID=UPI0027376EEE|nr:lipopolysaccharide assembly protein LapA domain-containing protein [Humidesulfovibrio sp.]MDP2847944.1 lipopolysaccharide assembly protein LapA domain-containing protein [Humidesulfovibrio sp.]
MRYLKFFTLLLVFVVSMLFFVQNNQPLSTTVVLEFNVVAAHLYSLPLPLYLLVLGGFFLGAVFCLAFLLVDRIRLGLELKTLRTRYAGLEDEVLSLRTIPLNQSQNQPGQLGQSSSQSSTGL